MSQGLVDWRYLTLPGEQPNVEGLYNRYAWQMCERFWPQESLEVNDCLYRNLHQHDYLAVIDLDEMIMPQNHPDWHGLIDDIEVSKAIYKWHMVEVNRAITQAYMTLTQSWQFKAYFASRHSFVCEDRE